MSRAALTRAIEASGGPKALSRKIGISSQAISQWQDCPPLRVLDVERASGIPRHELREDLYPQDNGTSVEPTVAGALEATREAPNESPCIDPVGFTTKPAAEVA